MILPAEYETQVYWGENGHVVIKQDDPMTEQEITVFLSESQMAKIVAWFNDLTEEA